MMNSDGLVVVEFFECLLCFLERCGAGSTPAPVGQLSLSVVVASVLHKLSEKGC